MGFMETRVPQRSSFSHFIVTIRKEMNLVATFGSHLEQTLSRAIRYGHMELAAKDSMLRSKFWTGLRSQQLRNATRYLYDTHKGFSSLLREIRKVEQEESCSQRLVQPTVLSKQKVAQQHSSRCQQISLVILLVYKNKCQT